MAGITAATLATTFTDGLFVKTRVETKTVLPIFFTSSVKDEGTGASVTTPSFSVVEGISITSGAEEEVVEVEEFVVVGVVVVETMTGGVGGGVSVGGVVGGVSGITSGGVSGGITGGVTGGTTGGVTGGITGGGVTVPPPPPPVSQVVVVKVVSAP